MKKDIKGKNSTLVKQDDWVVLMSNDEYKNSGLQSLEEIQQEMINILGIPKKYLGKK